MDSMKRSEACSSHHQNKVVSTNQATDSNSKQVNLSGSTLNNNTVSNKQNPSQTPGTQITTVTTASASDITKDSNFEYDDNEWDVGIGDLIIDLDADIEKSSVGNQQHQQPPSNQLSYAGGPSTASSQPLATLSPQTPLQSDKTVGLRKTDSISTSSQSTSEPAGGKSVKGNLPPGNAKHISSPVTLPKGGTTSASTSKQHSSTCSSSSSSLSLSLFIPGQQQPHHHHHKTSSNVESGNRSSGNTSKHSVLLSQLNSKHTSLSSLLSSPGASTLNHSYSSGGSSCSSSSTDFESSKGSKESSSTNMSSTTSGSGGKSATKLAVDHQATLDKGLKMKIKRTKPGTKTSEAKHEIVKAEQNGTSSLSSSNVDEANNSSSSISGNKKHSSQSQSQAQQQVTSPSISQQQGTKRGSSGHRRDKTKEKATHHNQRDKNEHNNNSGGSGSVGSTSTSSSADRCCNCTHDIQVNGVQQPCSSASCIRSRTTDPSMTSLTQRLSNQNNSSTSTSSLFASNSNTGPSISSSNAPGPPSSKDNAKHSTSSVGSNSSGGSSGNSSTASNSSSCSSTSASSSNNVLKSQLQSSAPPSSLINALSSVSAAGSSVASTSGNNSAAAGTSAGASSSSSGAESSSALSRDDRGNSPPPAKRLKCDPKDMVDVCVGTSVGTITEPDCLGPCEPGTSVTLEGIVWHETEGGVLVVNVTWRGKTYVGTLIDCTKHDWAPPRFCDSPTEEFDSRTPKGRGKRGRNSTLFPVNDLSNFTETRSSMHSKLRNGGTKGRGGRGTSTTAESSSSKTATTSSTTTANSSASGSGTNISSNTPSTSPVAFLPPRPEKRKSKDEPPSPVNGSGNAGGAAGGTSSNNSSGGTSIAGSSSVGGTAASNASSSIANNGPNSTQSGVAVNPMTGLNVQISTKKCKSSSSPCAISPVLLECPEQDCSKKYKHANGLRYHQSHAHGSVSSMDEDSSQPPEPPTTPSPLPTVQLVNFPPVATSTSATATSPSSTSSTALTTTTPSTFSSVSSSGSLPTASSVAVTQSNSNIGTVTTTTTTTTTSSSGSTPAGAIGPPSLLMVANVSTASTIAPTTTTTTITSPHSTMATVPISSVATQSTTTTTASAQHTVTSLAAAGGSITTGVAGPLVPQMQLGSGGNPTLLSTALAGAQNGSGLAATQSPSGQPVQGQSALQQSSSATAQVNTNSGTGTPNKSKTGVLRFGPLPQTAGNETDHTQRLMSSAPPGGALPNSMTLPGNPSALQPTAAASGTPEALNIKAQNCSKQKKNRKSPGPSEFDVAASSRAEDVQSPAYSDISDDSTPVVDAGDLDKSKGPQHQDATKKSSEAIPGPLGPLSGYGIYPYYPGMQHQSPYYSADHSAKPPGLGHSPLGPNAAAAAVDYKSNKEPPLDLMNKPIQQQPPPQSGQSVHSQQMAPGDLPGAQPGKDGPIGPPSSHPGAGKMMQHFYPYGYMPAGFGYNLDPNYGPVPMMSDENKHTQQQQPSGQIKEERIKESPSPSEYTKLGPQMVPTKVIKSEPMPVKDIKTEGGHSLHPKDQPPPGQQPGQPPLSAYGGMFQRHGLNVGPPTQHLNREEELRRLFNYSDQRRSSAANSSSAANLNTKEEPSSPSQVHPPGHPNHGSVHGPPSSQSVPNTSQQQSQQQQQQHKGSKNSSSQQQLKQPKDIKSEDKEPLKVKQEGQKPTMETQGPPPPPTSQYYPHSLYMSAAPFGFDPNHQMYRNMLVPAASYSAPPYHLQIPRYTSPEDLSRNPSTKALDLLQHHASQYYNSHKIHELREGALKSPTSNVKVSVSSPNLSQQSSQNPNMCIPPSNSSISSSGLSLQQQQQQAPPSTHSQQQPPGPLLPPSQAGGPNAGSNPGGSSGVVIPDQQKDPGGSAGALGPGPALPGGPPQQPGQPPGSTRSPPPQRHVHTHHHTHVGLGYPMFQAPYGAAVLASQQAAAAVTVISPFQTGPPAK